jgi:hypothetical protein
VQGKLPFIYSRAQDRRAPKASVTLWSIQDVCGADISSGPEAVSLPTGRETEMYIFKRGTFEGSSRHVLRFTPYHCELNPTELKWAEIRTVV